MSGVNTGVNAPSIDTFSGHFRIVNSNLRDY